MSQFFTYAKAGGSIGAARVVAQVAQFLTFIVAARFLGVAEFGVYALAIVAIMFLLLFAGFGWGQLAATREEEREEALWLAQRAGIVLCLVVLVGSFMLGQTGVIAQNVMVLGFCLAPLLFLRAHINVWNACLIVDGKAAKVAKAEAFSELVAMLVAISSLAAGFGLVSLGFAKLAQEITAFFLIRRVAPFTQVSPSDGGKLGRQVHFAKNIIGGRAITFLNENISTILIGLLLGASDTGLYRAGARISASGREVIVETLRTTFWMRLKQVAPQQRMENAKDLIFWAVTLAMLCLAGLALVADLVVVVLLGDEWAGAAIVASILALRGVILMPQAILEAVLSFTDRAELGPRLAIVSAVASVALLVVFTPFGLMWAAASQALAALVALVTTGWALNRVLGMSPKTFVSIFPRPLTCGVAMAASVLAFRYLHSDIDTVSRIIELIGSICIGFVTFVVTLSVLHRPVRSVLLRWLSFDRGLL